MATVRLIATYPAFLRCGRDLVVLVVVLFAIGPIVWTVLTSFKTESEIVSRQFIWLPHTLTIDNYVTLWERSGYPRSAPE